MNTPAIFPYEKQNSLWLPDRTLCLDFYLENPKQQMPRTKRAVEEGTYVKWLAQLTEQQLEWFIHKNLTRARYLAKSPGRVGRDVNTYLWRNSFYRLELELRKRGALTKEEVYTRWYESEVSSSPLLLDTLFISK